MRYIAPELQFSIGFIETILHNRLKLSKVSAHWVSHLHPYLIKQIRMKTSQEVLNLFNADPLNFLDRIVTQDETWVPHFDLESKTESPQWKHTDFVTTAVQSDKVGWKYHGDRFFGTFLESCQIDFLTHGRTINGEYFAYHFWRNSDLLLSSRGGKVCACFRTMQQLTKAGSLHPVRDGKAINWGIHLSLFPLHLIHPISPLGLLSLSQHKELAVWLCFPDNKATEIWRVPT